MDQNPLAKIIFLGFIFFLLSPGWGFAQEQRDFENELKEIRERLKALELEESDVTDDDGHRLHPVRRLYGTTINGGLTTIFQGSLNNSERFGGDRSEAFMSADLIFEYGFGAGSSFLFRFDVVQGEGLTSIPSMFLNPNGNPSGPNGDVEGFNNQQLNINEVRYEHRFFDNRAMISFGQIDLTSYFDQNNYANSETDQFLANQFVNNNAIDWGGSENFYGPGLVVSVNPDKMLGLSIGFFEGDGDYKDFFDNPFLIGQLSIQTETGGREGNVRLYGWGRLTKHCRNMKDLSVFQNCALIDSDEQIKVQDQNSGFGISLDHQVTDHIGVWSRFGYQDPDVSQFDLAISGGVIFSGGLIGRFNDELGMAYGVSFPSSPYTLASGFNEVEHYVEVYYRLAPLGNGARPEIQFSPDIQIVANPGGDSSVAPVFIWGFRTQVNF